VSSQVFLLITDTAYSKLIKEIRYPESVCILY